MGGTTSKPSVSCSKENAERNNKRAPKETPKPVPFIIENVSLPPDKSSPTRRRRFSKKRVIKKDTPRTPRAADDVKTSETSQVVGEQHAPPSKSSREQVKIGTLVREGVTNISKTLKDWTVISSRGSRSAAPVILTTPDRKKSSSPTISPRRAPPTNQFNFHHASYLAQSKQEKLSSVDFSAPRHLNSATKQPCAAATDYVASATKQRDGMRRPVYSSSHHMRSRHQSPDNIPAPRRYDRRKDRSPYYNKANKGYRQSSPSYLYSLELKQGSSEHCHEASPMYITRSSRAHSPKYMAATYRDRNVITEKPSRDKIDAVKRNSSSEWANSVGDRSSSRCCLDAYSKSIDKDVVPIYLPGMQQDVVVQRVKVKPDLDYAVIKPKTIRVNGIEYVRRKSNHPLMKQLLTIDKDQTKVSTILRERAERDQTSKNGKTSKEEKDDVNIANENRLRSYEAKELKISLEKPQRKDVDKDIEKRETIKSKTNGRDIDTKVGSKPVNEEKVSDGSETKCNVSIETTKRNKNKMAVETQEPQENERSSKRDETSTKVIDRKDKAKHDSNSEVVREKKDTNKHELNPNSRESEEGARKDANKWEKNAKDGDKRESTRHEHDITTIELKPLSKADRELIKPCRIRHMPVAVSSTGCLCLPSTKFSATPMASMCDLMGKVSACASDKSYCRLSRTDRLSPNRLQQQSSRRADHLAKQRGNSKLSAEHQKTCAPKEGNQHANTGGGVAIHHNSPNRSPNRSPRSTSPARNHKTGDGRTSLKREQPVLVCCKEQRMSTEQSSTLLNGDEKTNRNVDTQSKSSPNQACNRTTEGENQTNKHEPKKLVVENCVSTGSSNSSPKEVSKRASQRSIDVWCSKSVRSKNKIFETIIERTVSMQQTSPRSGEQGRESRRSSPQSQKSDTPFSKAIKLKYRAISAKRLSRPDVCNKREAKQEPAVIPKVYTPWDSCMMFKPNQSRTALPQREESRSPGRHPSSRQPTPTRDGDHGRSKAPGRGGRLKQCPKSPPIWEETPGAGERRPTSPKVQIETCQQALRNHLSDIRTRQVMDCSCDLGACNCIEVKNRVRCSRPRDKSGSPVSSRYTKLNREKVEDFEKKFRNTQVYRSVMAVARRQPSGIVTCKDNHARAVPAHGKGHAADVPAATAKVPRADGSPADPAAAKRGKRCPSCGKHSDACDNQRRCADCGGPLDKSSGDDDDDDDEAVEVRGVRGKCLHCGEQHDMRGCTLQCCVHCDGGCGGGARWKDNQHESGQGSSSGLSNTSGHVPPYRKVLKMFETKSKQHATATTSPRLAPPLSKQRSLVRPAANFDHHHHHRGPGGPRDVIIERRRPPPPGHRPHRGDQDDSEDDEATQRANDPHFNRSELELFKNARLQWMARDQQKRQPRHHQPARAGGIQAQQARKHPTPASSSMSKRRGLPVSKAQDSATNGK